MINLTEEQAKYAEEIKIHGDVSSSMIQLALDQLNASRPKTYPIQTYFRVYVSGENIGSAFVAIAPEDWHSISIDYELEESEWYIEETSVFANDDVIRKICYNPKA